MREDIYYWKCDAPYPAGGEKGYLDPGRRADMLDRVARITQDHFGEAPLTVTPTDSPGNHFTYVVSLRDRDVFFRSDDGTLDDDYMLAEAEAMRLARLENVPVPEVYHSDVTMQDCPVRYQLLEYIEADTLDVHYNRGRLACETVAFELGKVMARMHRITLDGFGFIDTQRLRTGGNAAGLHASHGAYFYRQLEAHLDFLVEQSFLPAAEAMEITRLLDTHAVLLDVNRGSLVHKDIAFWNILGDPDRIRAIVDWDDVIAGDPMDDIAILRCFHDSDIMTPLLAGYRQVGALPEDYRLRLSLYLVRNLLWKAVIRIRMGFFENPETCFMVAPGRRLSAREWTYRRLRAGVEELTSGRGADL